MTNFERIKNMSVKEIAEQLSYIIDCDDCPIEKAGGCSHLTICNYKNCENHFKKWLESEAEE